MTRKLWIGRTSIYVGRPIWWLHRFWGKNWRYLYVLGVRIEWWRWTIHGGKEE